VNKSIISLCTYVILVMKVVKLTDYEIYGYVPNSEADQYWFKMNHNLV